MVLHMPVVLSRKRVSWWAVVHSAGFVGRWLAAFSSLDEDGSGKISVKEVKAGLEKVGMVREYLSMRSAVWGGVSLMGLLLLGQTPTDDEVQKLVDRFDVNGDGELDIDEWLELAAIMFLGKGEQELQRESFSVRG